MEPLRIAAVPYLNLRPFLAALESRRECRLILRSPSAIPAVLAREDLDLCLLSTVDLFALGLEPLRGASIASEGRVESVALFSSLPPSRWMRVALDPASSTSNRLTGIVLEEGYHSCPSLRIAPDPEEALREGRCDAALLIGDRALRGPRQGVVIDLGQAWRSLTGLPFVFAAWVPGRRGGRRRAELEDLLAEAREESRMHVRASAARHAGETGLPAPYLERYLEDHISYRLGERELAGMALFRKLLAERASPRRVEAASTAAAPAGGRR